MPWVRWHGALVPREMFTPPPDLGPGVCRHCGGLGEVPEQIDEERFDVMVPCYVCQRFCRECNRYVNKTGHECRRPDR